MTRQKLGFVGYGAMASRMGARLADAGYDILAHVPAPPSAGDRHGVRYLDSAQALAAEADTVLVSVPDDASLAQAMYGPHGAIAGARPGGLVINLSSVSPGASLRLAEAGAEAGLAVLDAPVSGSTPEAEAGKLIVLVGGDAADFARARPIFSVIGSKAIHVGPAGQGSIIKLVVNGIMGAGMVALAETIGYGLAAGLDRDRLFETLDGLAVISPHHRRKLQHARVGDDAPEFPTRLMHKDIGLLVTEAATVGLPVAAIAGVSQSLALSPPENDDRDYSALVGVMAHLGESLAARRR